MNDPLFTPEQAYRWGVRIRLADDLDRVATAVWWGRYTVEDALREIRAAAHIVAMRMKIDPILIDAAVPDWLDEELTRHEAAHAASLEAMTAAGVAALRRGGARAAVRRAVALCAADQPILPPLHIMDSAVEAAAIEHRRAESWWRKREAAE